MKGILLIYIKFGLRSPARQTSIPGITLLTRNISLYLKTITLTHSNKLLFENRSYYTNSSIKYLFSIVLLFVSCLSLSAQDSAKKTPPLSVTGSAGVQGVAYSTDKVIPSRAPLSYSIAGDLNLSIYNVVQLPFSFIISEQERHLSQPFNQFGISPTYKWLKVHLGYRSLSFSPYTLNGYTFLGGGVEINTNLFRFALVGGRFSRALTGVASIDTVDKPIYTRTGYSMKLGYGTEEEHFDFIVFSARDKATSLSALDATKGHPAENLVMGIHLVEPLYKYFFFEGNYAYSLYTDDTKALPLSEVKNGATDITIPSAEGIFIPRVNTRYFQALDAAMAFKSTHFGMKLKYTRIDPGFQSLGTYTLNSDVENLTLNPYLNAWKNKITFSGSLGLQRDNLYKTKAATSERTIGSASLNLNPSPFYGLTFQYNNYSTNQAPGLKVINDTIRLAQVSSGISIMPHYMLQTEKFVHSWMLMWMQQTLVDNNQFTNKFSEYQTKNVNLTYSLSFIKSGLGLNVSYNISNTVTSYGISDYNGFTVGASKSIKKIHLGNSLSITYNNTEFNKQSSGNVINVRLSETYRIGQHSVSLSIFQLNNNSTLASHRSFHELTATIGYYFNF